MVLIQKKCSVKIIKVKSEILLFFANRDFKTFEIVAKTEQIKQIHIWMKYGATLCVVKTARAITHQTLHISTLQFTTFFYYKGSHFILFLSVENK